MSDEQRSGEVAVGTNSDYRGPPMKRWTRYTAEEIEAEANALERGVMPRSYTAAMLRQGAEALKIVDELCACANEGAIDTDCSERGFKAMQRALLLTTQEPTP